MSMRDGHTACPRKCGQGCDEAQTTVKYMASRVGTYLVLVEPISPDLNCLKNSLRHLVGNDWQGFFDLIAEIYDIAEVNTSTSACERWTPIYIGTRSRSDLGAPCSRFGSPGFDNTELVLESATCASPKRPFSLLNANINVSEFLKCLRVLVLHMPCLLAVSIMLIILHDSPDLYNFTDINVS